MIQDVERNDYDNLGKNSLATAAVLESVCIAAVDVAGLCYCCACVCGGDDDDDVVVVVVVVVLYRSVHSALCYHCACVCVFNLLDLLCGYLN